MDRILVAAELAHTARLLLALVPQNLTGTEKDLARLFKNKYIPHEIPVAFMYTKRTTGKSRRVTLTPKELVKIRGKWAVKGFDHDRRDDRTFYLYRIGEQSYYYSTERD